MRVRLVMEGKIKKPKVGDQYCAYGLGGRRGFYCNSIKKITNTHLILDEGNKIPLKGYYTKNIINARKKTVWVVVV